MKNYFDNLGSCLFLSCVTVLYIVIMLIGALLGRRMIESDLEKWEGWLFP
jgi:hypothetical protein